MVLGANIFPIKTKEVTTLFEGNDKRGLILKNKYNLRINIKFWNVLNILSLIKSKWIINSNRQF